MLHANGAAHSSGAERPFVGTQPQLPFRPAIPWLEQQLPQYGAITSLYRWLRVAWTLALIPLHLGLWFASLLPLPKALQPPVWLLPGADVGWTPLQRLALPPLKRLLWSITDVGGGPQLSPKDERTYTDWIVRAQHWVFGDATHHVQVGIEDCPPAEDDQWIIGEAMDPRGLVKPAPVPCFWFDARGEEGSQSAIAARRAKEGERVVLYFVGGGYSYGSPIEGNRCFILAERTGLLVVGANYRKATSADRAFPAALQDAVSSYSHLLNLGFEDIVIAGDSAGGGLAMSLILYLTNTLKPSKPCLILPTAVLLYSPWVDLTLSAYRDGLATEPAEHDIISPSMLYNARNAYLQNLSKSSDDLEIEKLSLDSESPFVLGPSHPFLSPALPSSLPALQLLAKSYSPKKPLKMLILAGGSEILAPEVRALVDNLRRATVEGAEAGIHSGIVSSPIDLEYVEARGEVHGYVLVPSWVSPAAGKALVLIETFLKQ